MRRKLRRNLIKKSPKTRIQNSLKNMTMVTTVKDNEKFYSKAQRVRVRKAIDVYYSLGMPAKDNFKNMIRMNMIRNIPIKMKDIDIAFEIYGD